MTIHNQILYVTILSHSAPPHPPPHTHTHTQGFAMTIHNQILYVTIFSAVFSTLGLATAGQLGPALAFVSRHPEALSSILALSAASTCGQLFISHTIKSYGALLFATVMTTRQFLSILISCLLFAHPLTLGQWAGTAMVFGEPEGGG